MSSPVVTPDAYTDAPALHPHLLIGSLQLLLWLFFHPSAWRNYVSRVDPDLPPNFSLIGISRAQWRNPDLRRLLLKMYLICPLLVGLLVGLILVVSGGPLKILLLRLAQRITEFPSEAAAVDLGAIVTHGIAYSISVTVTVGIMGGGSLGAAYGLTVGVVSGILGGIACGVGFDITKGVSEVGFGIGATVSKDEIGVLLALTLGESVATGASTGAAGAMANAFDFKPRTFQRSLARQLVGIAAGILLSGAAILAGFGVGDIVRGIVDRIVTSNLASSVTFGMVSGVILGIMYGLALRWRTPRWRRAAILGVAVGVLVGLVYHIVMVLNKDTAISAGDNLMLGAVAGGANGALLSSLFVLPYVPIKRFVGSWAGAVAGALGSGGIYVIYSSLNNDVHWVIIPICMLSILVGLTFNSWRPIALYPLLGIWNLVLYRADERRSPDRPSLFRWHSAFWDEHQRLRLTGLDEHLLLVMERSRAEGRAAMEYLITSHQRWAAQSVQIELDARALESCFDVVAISQAHHSLAVGELTGPANALLRTLNRISHDVEVVLKQASAYHKRLALNSIEDRLDKLLRELTRSSERYAVRFRPIVIRWRQIISNYVQRLIETVELQQEIDNPYIVGVPLTEEQEIFVGRIDVVAQIEQLLLDRRSPPLLLYGQRRMGKTSLLCNLGRLLPSTTVPLFVDGQRIVVAADYPDLLHSIARQMTEAAKRQRSLTFPSLDREALRASPFTCFNDWLDQIEQGLDIQGLNMALLALDEFETALERVLDEGRFDETDFLHTLRHLIQHRPRFKVLMVSSHTPGELGRWASYLINAQVIKLGYLRQGETRQLIEQPSDDFDLRYKPEASQRVAELTRGHPHLVQLLCYEIVNLKNEQPPARRRLVDTADVEAAVPRALRNGTFFFTNIERDQIDKTGAEVLRFLAAQGEGQVREEALAEQFPQELDSTLDLLLRRDLIEATGEGYQFQVKLIRRWFVR